MTTEAMYIRFGDLPEGQRSWNDELQQREAGVSVYPATWQDSDRSVVCITIPADYCYATAAAIADRPVYIVTGDLLAERGGDGEPLLVNCHAELVGVVEVVNYCVEEN